MNEDYYVPRLVENPVDWFKRPSSFYPSLERWQLALIIVLVLVVIWLFFFSASVASVAAYLPSWARMGKSNFQEQAGTVGYNDRSRILMGVGDAAYYAALEAPSGAKSEFSATRSTANAKSLAGRHMSQRFGGDAPISVYWEPFMGDEFSDASGNAPLTGIFQRHDDSMERANIAALRGEALARFDSDPSNDTLAKPVGSRSNMANDLGVLSENNLARSLNGLGA